MLSTAKLGAFIPTLSSEKARTFYVDILGLRFVSDDPFALVLESNGVNIRVTKVERFTPHPFTTLGWEVEDIRQTVSSLREKGVTFEKYDFLEQDELDIWTVPVVDNATTETRVAWFKDPDGNLLSLSETT